ncbi:SpaA isopeptide-forming pilin-related protein [Blautia luti]|uniref:Trypsin-resistant surface T6 protein n=1 Tax=Blautia luti TaxID=89014 RepID=A0A564VBV1_9FIRM|nr:SpaA isopeptide-forming pilin-related protein [Blautia luti]VUX30016.1 Trypsin-resistant surface T6 protein precursor [Blautia luti]
MKNLFKKIGALLVAAVMVLSMCTAVFAAIKTDATITVTNAAKATLTYAQVIKADQSTKTGWNFVDDKVAEAYVDAFGVADAQAAIEAMIPANNVDANKLGAAQANAAGKVNFVTMANPQTVNEAGVYLIKATEAGYTYNLMSAYIGFGEVTKINDGEEVKYEYPSLVDATLNAKKTETKVEKEAVDDDNVVATGDILTYKVKTNVPFIAPTDTDKTFWAYDELTGAEYTKNATITLDGETNDVTATYPITWDSATKFSVNLSGMIDDANSNAGKEVVITYTVKVTSENDTITNKATAGHKDKEDFGSKEIKVYEGNITLTKTGENDVKLANAGFEVRKASKESDALKFTRLADGVYKYDPKGTVTEVFTKADGTVKVQGLDVGTYYFKEITAPKGYSVNQNQSEATLAVGEDGKATAVLTKTTSMTDTKLSSLPSTGGMGTYLFTIIGVVVMVGAAGAFFISRRKGSEE